MRLVAAIAATLPLLASAAAFAAPPDTSWREHDRLARAAFAAGDLGGADHHFRRADRMVRGHAGARWNLAIVAAQRGRIGEALGHLEDFAATGLHRDANGDTLLAPLRGHPRFRAVVGRLEANRGPRVQAKVAFDLGDPSLLAEDVAWDPGRDRFLVSSIHRRKVVALERDSTVRDFAGAGRDDVWAAMALAVDVPRGLLWLTTCAIPTMEGWSPSDSGRAAVLAFDLASGEPRRRIEFPRDGRPHLLGDMTLAPDGTVYVSDAAGGGVYALRDTIFETVVAPGLLESPQTPVPTPDGRYLLVPDYRWGIASVDLHLRTVSWIEKPADLAAAGIDDLDPTWNGIVAIQNGTTPRRVLWFETDPARSEIVRWRVLDQASPRLGEPTHGVVVGQRYYLIGDSGRDRVDVDRTLVLTPQARAPVLLRLDPPRGR